ncbi:MAG: curlin [Nitratireductor sp.]
MFRTATSRYSALLLAAAIGVAAPAVPAPAGGSIGISIAPGTAEADRALRAGLQIYSLFNAARGNALVRQNGQRNQAGIAQAGRGNYGLVHQDGTGHSGTLAQNGDRNAYGLFQFGRDTRANVTQNGHGRSGATFLFGW